MLARGAVCVSGSIEAQFSTCLSLGKTNQFFIGYLCCLLCVCSCLCSSQAVVERRNSVRSKRHPSYTRVCAPLYYVCAFSWREQIVPFDQISGKEIGVFALSLHRTAPFSVLSIRLSRTTFLRFFFFSCVRRETVTSCAPRSAPITPRLTTLFP